MLKYTFILQIEISNTFLSLDQVVPILVFGSEQPVLPSSYLLDAGFLRGRVQRDSWHHFPYKEDNIMFYFLKKGGGQV